MGISKEVAHAITEIACLIKEKESISAELEVICSRVDDRGADPLLILQDQDDGTDHLSRLRLYEAGQRQALNVTKIVYSDAVEAIEKDIYELSIKLTELLNNK